MSPCLDQFAERLAVGIDVLEQLVAGVGPALQSALQGMNIGVAERGQALAGRRDQALAIVVEHDLGVLARDAIKDLQLQPAQRQLRGEQRVGLGEGVFLAQVDQGDLAAGDQVVADLARRDGQQGHGVISTGVGFERSQRLGRVVLA
jgi:hypothetical protein